MLGTVSLFPHLLGSRSSPLPLRRQPTSHSFVHCCTVFLFSLGTITHVPDFWSFKSVVQQQHYSEQSYNSLLKSEARMTAIVIKRNPRSLTVKKNTDYLEPSTHPNRNPINTFSMITVLLLFCGFEKGAYAKK